jgi:hypothetical protein
VHLRSEKLKRSFRRPGRILMPQPATALEPVGPLDSTTSTNLQIVFGSRSKLDQLSKNVVKDFRADILRIATTNLADANVGNVDVLCNAWTQLQERYKNRSAALATFKTELTNTISFFKRDHSAELRAELQQLVDKCDQELQQRSHVDECILEQKATLIAWMAELDADDYTTTPAGQRQTVAKKAPKKTTRTTG